MDNDNLSEIKIRALPRKGEEDANRAIEKAAAEQSAKTRRWIVYAVTPVMFIAAFALMFKPSGKTHKSVAASKAMANGKMDLASINARINDSVTRHLQDAEVQAEMMKRNRELENAPFRNALKDKSDQTLTLPDTDPKGYGVSLDSDNSDERVFEDLDSNSQGYSDTLPADKINARIANRKWMKEMEKNEKIQFISAFIRSAYDKGYEVEIDQNLVVVGVKKLPQNKLLNIDQVIDRLAKDQ